MLRFGAFELDVDGRRLLRDGRPVPLEPQAFDVLADLIDHRDRAVSKGEVLDRVWGDRWVSESALTTRVKEIRRAVGDTGEAQAVVRTVRGHGYQFVAPVTDDAAPATGPHATGPHATGPHASGTLGRDRDLEELTGRLVPGALVTLVGPGGVGKTTVGRALASRLRGRFRDGCISIDLTVIRDRDELRAVIARAAQIIETDDTVAQLLRHLDALLLLDDADELITDVAELCAGITDEGSRLAVLVTCRERLGVPHEQIWPVLPLSADDACNLLQTRAAQLAPLGSIADAEPEEIAELAASVDHLPLALEMLAGASAHLGLADLSDLVTLQPAMLTDPRRHGPARHRSLEVLVDDSIDRLSPRSSEALGLIATFAGPFRLIDAAALLALESDALNVVRDLVDRSLLAPAVSGADGPRFQMLRTVARAVHRRSDAAAVQARRHRHAEWVTGEARAADAALRSTAERKGSDRFVELSDDARLAHAWARMHDVPLALELTEALHLYAHSRGWLEPAQWAEAIPQWREHGAAVAAVASQASQTRRFDDAKHLAGIARENADAGVRAWGLEVSSDVALYQGDLDTAMAAADELLTLGLVEGDARMVAIGTTNAVLSRAYDERALEAIDVLDSYPRGGPVSEAPTDQAWIAYATGESRATSGSGEQALRPLQEAVSLGLSADSPFVVSVARATIASLQVDAGDVDAAVRIHRDLVNTFRRHGIITHLTITLRNTASLLAILGRDREALTLCGWLLGPHGHPGYGRALSDLLRVQSEVRARHDDTKGTRWEQEGAAMTAPEISDLVARTLDT